MDIRELTRLVFEKVGRNFEEAESEDGMHRKFKLAQTENGFWLLLEDNGETTSLSLWLTKREAIINQGFSYFELSAGSKKSGTRSLGKGTKMIERAEVRVLKAVDIDTYIARDVFELILRTFLMGCSEGFELSQYWKPDNM